MSGQNWGYPMRRMLFLTLTACAAFGAAPAALAEVNLPVLVSICKSGKCQSALKSTIRQLEKQDLTEDDWNAQIGYVALALFESARTSEVPKTRLRVSDALVDLAGFSTEEGQKEAFMFVARAIAEGDGSLWELEDPFAASPS